MPRTGSRFLHGVTSLILQHVTFQELSLLQHLMDKSKAASTLKEYFAQISAYHVPFGGSFVLSAK